MRYDLCFAGEDNGNQVIIRRNSAVCRPRFRAISPMQEQSKSDQRVLYGPWQSYIWRGNSGASNLADWYTSNARRHGWTGRRRRRQSNSPEEYACRSERSGSLRQFRSLPVYAGAKGRNADGLRRVCQKPSRKALSFQANAPTLPSLPRPAATLTPCR